MIARGFRGNYFRLTAIAATAGAVKQRRLQSALRPLIRFPHRERPESDPPEEILSELPLSQEPDPRRHPCHCSRLFRHRCRLVLRLRKRNRYPLPTRDRYSGIAPPFPPDTPRRLSISQRN